MPFKSNMDESQPDSAISAKGALDTRALLDAANLLTLIGLASSLCSAFLAIQSRFAFAIVAIMISGLCDLFDGVLARRMTRDACQGKFGGHLDSLVDACAFGVAPVILVISTGSNSIGEQVGLIFFACCVVWRLAYFETTGLNQAGKRQYFTGLPVTYVAFFLPLAFLSGFADATSMRITVDTTMLLLAIAMISKVQIRKPSGIFYVLFPLIGIVLIVIYTANADSFPLHQSDSN